MDGSAKAGLGGGQTHLRLPGASVAPTRHAPAPAEPLADLDTQLMLQAAQGDRAAASRLIERNRDRIARYIAQILSDQRAVEDLTQEVFLQALRHADQYRPTAKVTTWLYCIATNLARNHLKDAGVRRRLAVNPETALDIPDPHEPPPDRQLSLDELKAQVARAIRELPLKQRIALTLCQYEGCSYEQAAVVLDASVEAVRSLLLRARRRLRETLADLR